LTKKYKSLQMFFERGEGHLFLRPYALRNILLLTGRAPASVPPLTGRKNRPPTTLAYL
jgi:hypothetical protein